MEEEFKEFLSSAKKALEDVIKTNNILKQEILKSTKKLNDVADYCVTSLKNSENQLKDVKKTNENVEESLCNVLVAIRQNEYLQAWYPPQHGYPEMKVTGKHPAKL